MSFSFGQSTFGSGSKQPAFGTPFGTTTTTSAPFGATTATPFGTTTTVSSSGFGSSFGGGSNFGTAPTFGSTFGAPGASTSTAFGSTFGQPISSVAPAFGSSFGATPAVSSAPAFGSTFGAAGTSSAAPAFGRTFGAPASTAPSLFGTAPKPSLFGAPATSSLFPTPSTSSNLFVTTSSQAPALFGGTVTAAPNLFAATTTTPSLFGTSFGTGSTAAPSLFGTSTSGLGTSTGGTGFSLFGPSTTSSAPSLFSGFGTTTAPSGFTGFGTGAGTSTSSFPGFGASTSAPNLFAGTFGAKPPTPTVVQAPADSIIQQTIASFYAINIFGDERDNVLQKWNMLQACWGMGKGYYSPSHPPVEYNYTNPFYRFKAVSYSVIPQTDNADGLVKMLFNRKDSEVSNQKEVLINGIGGLLGNKPNLTVTILFVKGTGDNECEVMFTVSEKGVTGTSRKIFASDLSAFLNQPAQRQQLANVGVTFIGPYMTPSKSDLEEYLRVPPAGVNQQMWEAAQIDNPNPAKYIPVPMNGFADLKRRLVCQEYETGIHRAYLEKATNEINELKRKHAASIALINEQKQKLLQLQHRVLKIIVKQEATRKAGLALQPEEEMIKARLETMLNQLRTPTQFRGQLNEVLGAVKIMNTLGNNPNLYDRYKMEPRAQEDIKQFLALEQSGIATLVNIIKDDLTDLKIIQDGMSPFVPK